MSGTLLLKDQIYHAASVRAEHSVFNALITRFFMQTSFSAGAEKSDDELRHWIDTRLEIFGRVCLPSILRQRRRPDLWLLGLDRRREALLQPVVDCIAGHDFIQPAWQEIGEPNTATFSRVIRQRVPAGTAEYLCTTRLDNDDALNAAFFHDLGHYIACIPEARLREDNWISFPVGCQYFGSHANLYLYPNNAFLSRLVPLRRFLGTRATMNAYGINHRKLFESQSQVHSVVTREPMWLQYIHGGNVSNQNRSEHLRLQDFASIRDAFFP